MDNASQQYIVELNFTCISGQSPNQPPIADAGFDQTVPAGQSVSLSGANSYDTDGSIVQYAWNFGDGSTGTGATTYHTYNSSGIYTLTLSVADDKGAIGTNTLFVTVQPVVINQPPVANAGPDQTVHVNDTVTLDGSGSSDVNGDPLTYQWSLITSPEGSTAALSDSTSVNPTFTVDLPGTYVAHLIVNDGIATSYPDTVTITSVFCVNCNPLVFVKAK